MTLSNPRAALAEQSSFIDYLLALSSAAAAVRALADDSSPHSAPGEADDFTHVLLGIASIGAAIERLGRSDYTTTDSPARASSPPRRWLR